MYHSNSIVSHSMSRERPAVDRIVSLTRDKRRFYCLQHLIPRVYYDTRAEGSRDPAKTDNGGIRRIGYLCIPVLSPAPQPSRQSHQEAALRPTTDLTKDPVEEDVVIDFAATYSGARGWGDLSMLAAKYTSSTYLCLIRRIILLLCSFPSMVSESSLRNYLYRSPRRAV